MITYAVETDNLTHAFSGNETVLNRVNLKVPGSSIYGFLGPNGAGKTTTLRLMLGLLKKQHGEVIFFGKPFGEHRIEILKRTGSLIESPSLYGHLTATENLRLLAKIYRSPKRRIHEVLQLVALADTGNKKTRQFSLGMKQRLGIAIAMLHNPSLLILDEPTNGLDPNGIIEIRALLKKLNQEEKITILLSSHLLSEIEKLVTHVGVIHKGSLLFQGTLGELMNKQQQSSGTIIETDDDEKAIRIIHDNHVKAEITDGKIVVPMMPKEKIAMLNQELVRCGIGIYKISTVRNDLETVFIDLVKN